MKIWIRLLITEPQYRPRNIMHVIRKLLHFTLLHYALEKLLHIALKDYYIECNNLSTQNFKLKILLHFALVLHYNLRRLLHFAAYQVCYWSFAYTTRTQFSRMIIKLQMFIHFGRVIFKHFPRNKFNISNTLLKHT